MADQDLHGRLARLKASLETLEREAGAGDIPRDLLADIKATIDRTRISLWAILATSQSPSAGGDSAEGPEA